MSTETTDPTVPAEVIMSNVEVTSKIEIGNAELVNIAVARRERFLLEEEARLEKLSRDLAKDGADLNKEFSKLCNTTVTTFFAKKAEALAEAYLIFDMKLTSSVSYQSFDSEDKKLRGTVTISNKERFSSSVAVNMDVTEEVVALNEKVVVNHEAAAKCSEDRMNNKRELSRLSTVERQARAAVTEAALGGSEKGRKLLASLESALPGMPKLLA